MDHHKYRLVVLKYNSKQIKWEVIEICRSNGSWFYICHSWP